MPQHLSVVDRWLEVRALARRNLRGLSVDRLRARSALVPHPRATCRSDARKSHYPWSKSLRVERAVHRLRTGPSSLEEIAAELATATPSRYAPSCAADWAGCSRAAALTRPLDCGVLMLVAAPTSSARGWRGSVSWSARRTGRATSRNDTQLCCEADEPAQVQRAHTSHAKNPKDERRLAAPPRNWDQR